MALVLRVGSRRSKGKHLCCCSHIVFFSTSDSNSPFSSLFKDIKDNLKQPSSSPSNSQRASADLIHKNLNEFRARTTAPPPGEQQISFQQLYHQNMHRNSPNSLDINAIRKSLQNINPAGTAQTSSRLMRPRPRPDSFFGKEVTRDGGSPPSSSSSSMSTAFLRTYSVEDLGEKLRMLRPEGMRKEWFSVRELSERLVRLRKMEEEQAHSSREVEVFQDLRCVLVGLHKSETDTAEKASRQGLSILSHLSGTPIFSLGPPKPHLVQKYFHPDNMSSADKLKIELAKVRDEFKMSQSDCGSARLQIAQLTTKIKHLSAVLHKKDVHSRKGLLAMVQRRKRLLKYLRRTDWDSYCFVISKLGLRDNPDHSYKTRSGMAA